MAVKLGNGNWAVKEDKLLAYNDNSGLFFNKEFDFSRGTSATYVAKDGLIKTAGIQPNIVNNGDFSELGSELVTNGDFDTDSDWTKGTGWSIEDGAAYYSGTTNSDLAQSGILTSSKLYKLQYEVINSTLVNGVVKLSGTTASAQNVLSQTVGTHTLYFVANGTAPTSLNIRIVLNTSGQFEIDNVSVKQVDPNDYWTLGSDWSVGDNKVIGDNSDTESTQQIFPDNTSRLLKIRYTLTVDSGEVAVYMSGQVKYWKTASGTYTDTITTTSKTIEFDGRNANPFSGTITDIIVQEIQTDTPRIDFTNDTKGHLLLEPSTTNLVPYSEDFSQWSLLGGISGSITYVSDLVNPDGSVGGYKISNSGIFVGIGLPSTAQRSIYARSVSGSGNAQLMSHNSNTNNVFTLTEEWQRFELNSSPLVAGNFYVDLRGSETTLDEIYVWGANATNSQDYLTSYIPTTGATSTRNADVCNNSGSAQDFNSEEGVLYAEIAALESTSSGSKFVAISDGTYNNRASILFSNGATNQIRCFLRVGGTPQVDKFLNVSDVKEFNKVAFSYKENEFKVFINGSQAGTTDTSGSVWSSGTITKLSLTEINSSLGAFNGKVRNVQVFTEALTDEQLQKLTS